VELIVFTISPAPLTSPPQTVEDAPAEPDLDSVDDSSDDSEVEQSEEKVLAQFAGGGTARESTRRNRTQTIQEQTATEAAAPAVGLLQDDNFPASQVLTEIVIDVAISEHVAASTLADLSTRRDFNSKAETKQLTPSDLASITSQHLLTTFAANGRTSIGLHQLKRDIHAQISFDDAVIGSVATVGSGLTAGYIMWAIRGGMLLSGLLAQMP
ncbi:MAG: hypothetical protein GY826_07370, partial [Fuerstiella sp.]|nr:hypothetical protein [Fuerstiella sp.]